MPLHHGLEVEEYCPHCDRVTLHKSLPDDVFDYAIKCMECETVWEAEPPDLEDTEGEEDDSDE